MKKVTLPAVSALCLFLASCAQTWSASQKAALGSVAVPPPVMADGAYKKPVGKTGNLSAPIMPVTGGSFAAGAVAGGLAQLMVEGVGAAQQSMYEHANADVISRVSGTVPGNFSERVRKAVVHELNTRSFFSGKVKDGSPNRLVVKVDSYGYVRTAKVGGKILMSPQIQGSFELIGSDGKKLIGQQRLVGSSIGNGRPLEDYVKNPKLAADGFDSAAAIFSEQISTAIDRKEQ